MKKITPFLIQIFIVSLFLSCNNKVVFDEKVQFQNANWAFENKAITFSKHFSGTEKPYSIILELDLVGMPNVDMFYATFCIFSPSGGRTVKSILFNFKNPQVPFIQGASENEKIYRLIVYPKRYFSETGEYKFEVNQFSNKADNFGIHSLRMYIERVKEER